MITSIAEVLLALVALQDPAPIARTALSWKALGEGDVAAAERTLGGVPEIARGFEWHHVALRLEIAKKAAARTAHTTPSLDPEPGAVTVLGTHVGAARTLAFSADGTRIASAGVDHMIKVWDTHTGLTSSTIDAHAEVASIAWSPDGAHIAAACGDGLLRVVDAANGSEVFAERAHETALRTTSWSRDGARIATGSIDGAVSLWDASKGTVQITLRGHESAITAVAFAAHDEPVSASEDGTLRLWDATSGSPRLVLHAHDGQVLCLCVDPHGDRIASGSADKTARVFTPLTGERVCNCVGSLTPVRAVSISPDSKRLAGAGEDGFVHVWDMSDAQDLLAISVSTKALYALAFSPDGARLATCGEDGLVRVLETDEAIARTAQDGATLVLPDETAAKSMKVRELDHIAWRVARRSGLSPEMYTRAEAIARGVTTQVKDAGEFMTTLAAILYRQGRLTEARDMLDAAQEKRRGLPGNIAFRAMTRAKLGDLDLARDALKRLEIVLQEPRWRGDPALEALRDEARATIASAKSK